MNSTRKANNQQPLSIRCPEQNLAALIAEAKTNFDGIFASLKRELVHYLLFSERELLAGPKYATKEGYTNWGSQEGSVYVAGVSNGCKMIHINGRKLIHFEIIPSEFGGVNHVDIGANRGNKNLTQTRKEYSANCQRDRIFQKYR